MHFSNISTIGELKDAIAFLEKTGEYHPDTPLHFYSGMSDLSHEIETLRIVEKMDETRCSRHESFIEFDIL